MKSKIILASKSEIRKKILDINGIACKVIPSNLDEDSFKKSFLQENASPEYISQNLALLKANKVSQKYKDEIVLGADSVIDLNGSLISKPKSRKEALEILNELNGKNHLLISSVCISKNGNMIWKHTDKATLTMKNLSITELKNYLNKISDKILFSYNVYQIEGEGKNLFSKIVGEYSTVMGLPIKNIRQYLEDINCSS